MKAWIDFWNEEEAPDTYALVRIVWAVVVLANLGTQLVEPGVITLFARPEDGGLWNVGTPTYSLFRWLEPTASTIWGLVILQVIAGIGLLTGTFTRVCALVLWALQISLAGRLGYTRFGGDTVFNVFSFLMVLAPLGASWSVDARLFGRRERVGTWPRRLAMAQLTYLYVKTGIVKAGASWSLEGGYSALYYALNDPTFARVQMRWTAWLYPLVQLAAFVARWWETLFFLLPLQAWLARRGRSVPDARPVFLGVGVLLHLSLFATMRLGMFPWVTLATYLFFLEPAEARRVLEWGRDRVVSRGRAVRS